MSTPNALLLVRWLVGSHAYGVAGPDSDRDYVEVYVEDPEYVTGLLAATNEQRVNKENDVARYPLRNWAALTKQGNPNMVETLFFEPEYAHPLWYEVSSVSESFLHKGIGRRFKGYAVSQIRSLEGERNMKTNRPELVAKYGWDTKWGYHAMRVACEGVNLMAEGELKFPTADASYLRKIREGEVSKDALIDQANFAITILDGVTERSFLPDKPDTDTINGALHAVYMGAWKERGKA